MKKDPNKLLNKNHPMNNNVKLNPEFDNNLLNPDTFTSHVNKLVKRDESLGFNEILKKLLMHIEPIDFEALAFPQLDKLKNKLKQIEQEITNEDGSIIEANKKLKSKIEKQIVKLKLNNIHILIISIENLLKVANDNNWGLCKNHESIYIYNGEYWMNVDEKVFGMFLGEAAEKMGVAKFYARHFQFKELLFKQFKSTAYLPTPESNKDVVLINLKNGTFEITTTGTRIRAFNKSDFLTYQLPFEFNVDAKAPIFYKFLEEVLPDKEKRDILAEYLGFVFIKNGNSIIKEEKCLLLYGSGANGKSVFYEVSHALFGSQNVSCYSLQSLTDVNGYYRAMLGETLVNYATEINGRLETSHFKAMVSGEPIEARFAYGVPFKLIQYAKLIFNCNELPKDVEHSNAYFRRLLIIHFDVTIPDEKQDKQLHNKIIENELSGVFNWVLDGLNRLLEQKKFTDCEAVRLARQQYEKQSDSVKLFLEELGYTSDIEKYKLIKDLYQEYKSYCLEDGYRPVNKTNFIKRLSGSKILVKRINIGNIAYLSNTDIPF